MSQRPERPFKRYQPRFVNPRPVPLIRSVITREIRTSFAVHFDMIRAAALTQTGTDRQADLTGRGAEHQRTADRPARSVERCQDTVSGHLDDTMMSIGPCPIT